MTGATIAHRRAEAIGVSTSLGHFRHPPAVEVNFADAFDPREDVINRLAPDADQLAPDNTGHEIARQIENFLRCPAIESLAQNRGHGAGERLDFGSKRHPKMSAALFIHLQV